MLFSREVAEGLTRVTHRWRDCCALALFLSVVACTSNPTSSRPETKLDDDAIAVGSFDFDESVLLAEVYSQGLESAGYTVNRQFRLGPREFVGPSLSAGLVELVPEYAATAAEFYSLGRAEPTNDVSVTHAALVDAVAGSPLQALAAAPAQDTNTFVVTGETAERLHLRTLSDLRPVAAQLKFGGPPERRDSYLVLCRPARHLRFAVRRLHHTRCEWSADPRCARQRARRRGSDVHHRSNDRAAGLGTSSTTIADCSPRENMTPLIRSELVGRFGPTSSP